MVVGPAPLGGEGVVAIRRDAVAVGAERDGAAVVGFAAHAAGAEGSSMSGFNAPLDAAACARKSADPLQVFGVAAGAGVGEGVAPERGVSSQRRSALQHDLLYVALRRKTSKIRLSTVLFLAVRILLDMATRKEIDESNPAAILGQRGGAKRAERMTAEERSDAARRAVEARWARVKAAAKKGRKKT